jgi:hypothetical protein
MLKNEYREKTKELFNTLSQLKDPNDVITVRNQIVQLNLPLVSTVLKKYRPYNEDQFQIGCIGLIKAADTYEMLREVPFDNYACFVIERELHIDYNKRMGAFEEKERNNLIYLDATLSMGNGDTVNNEDMIADPEAIRYMEEFIEENALQSLCENVIKPAIKETTERGRKMPSKINFDVWEQLEFRYIMSIIYEESQKKRFNLTQMAKACGVAVPNIRNRHERVMDAVFQRMWSYMTLSFSELLERIRGKHKIPKRLLCLDPGKTTGWSVFEDGKLTAWGHLMDCYDDKNVNAKVLTDMFEDVQPDYICYEDYRVYQQKLDRHSFSPVMTVRLLGVIEAYCQMKDIPTHKQMAVTAKNFCTDEKLKQWGFWQEGQKHARDSIRHGCYFLLFFKKGQDIVK